MWEFSQLTILTLECFPYTIKTAMITQQQHLRDKCQQGICNYFPNVPQHQLQNHPDLKEAFTEGLRLEETSGGHLVQARCSSRVSCPEWCPLRFWVPAQRVTLPALQTTCYSIWAPHGQNFLCLDEFYSLLGLVFCFCLFVFFNLCPLPLWTLEV